MLTFDGAWRFDSPGPISHDVVREFSALIGKIASQGEQQRILEHFKSYFATAAGSTASWSSSASWAQTDLDTYMSQASENAPLFIEAFFDACEALQRMNPEIAVPNVARMNRVLAECQAGYKIAPPNLVSTNLETTVPVVERTLSLDEQAQQIIQQSLHQSEALLAEGRNRQAVQEVLWLLETVSTAFKGLDAGTGSVQGKYFNKIAQDLRSHHRGTTLEQVLTWATTLHGYLSSPTGGGIRHGSDLTSGVTTQPGEARLFCNLIRSYILFLLSEHERLKSGRSQP